MLRQLTLLFLSSPVYMLDPTISVSATELRYAEGAGHYLSPGGGEGWGGGARRFGYVAIKFT